MTAYKISELTGALLDVAVAMAEGGLTPRLRFTRTMLDERQGSVLDHAVCWLYDEVNGYDVKAFQPSTAWEDGGQIIARERIMLEPSYAGDPYPEDWLANIGPQNYDGHYRRVTSYRITALGPTPLIAGMRAYVASKLGDTVELP